MSPDYSAFIRASLHSLLSETTFHADAEAAYILNPREPGLVETLSPLSAETVSALPGPGRKPIVAHANHVLYGWELVVRALQGDDQAFAGADWNAAWQLERVSEREWSELLARLEQVAGKLLALAPQHASTDEVMFTGLYACAAHTAYHLGAIRQMLRELQ